MHLFAYADQGILGESGTVYPVLAVAEIEWLVKLADGCEEGRGVRGRYEVEGHWWHGIDWC